jgi:hypothetical protein
VRSIQSRLKKIEDRLNVGSEPIFVQIEQRNGKRGITLPSGEWFEFPEEVKKSPRCKKVIVFGENGELLLRRCKHFGLSQFTKLGLAKV